MAVTLKDVAALAGVSPSTVSRTCSDHPSISEETKEKVRQAMAQLGYEPGPSSRPEPASLPLYRRTIGIILPPSQKEVYENSFYLEAIRGISQYCNHHQYTNTVITGQDEQELLQVIQAMAKDNQVDGFILLYSRQQDPILEYLYNEGLLYVLIGKAYQYVNQTIYIDNDNLLAGQEATPADLYRCKFLSVRDRSRLTDHQPYRKPEFDDHKDYCPPPADREGQLQSLGGPG